MRAPSLLLTAATLAGCQPSIIDIQYDKDAALYGSEDDPAGSTGSGGSSGGGDGGGTVDPDDPIVGTFTMAHDSDGGFAGAVSCEAWWDVTGEPASTECPDCGYTLDWAYSMSYTLDDDSVSLPSGCEWTSVGSIAGSGSYGDQILAMYLGTWAFSSDYASGGQLLMGYSYYGYDSFQPLVGAEVTVTDSSLEWQWVDVFSYGGYGYGYYDEYTVTQTWAGQATGQ